MLWIARLLPMVLLLTAASGMNAQQDWIPVTAKMRGTFETIRDGVTVIERKEGVFYRNSDGSVLKYWVSTNGDESQGGPGELFDNKNLLHYSINAKRRMAFQSVRKNPERATPGAFAANLSNSPLGNDSIEGMTCRRVPVIVQWPDGRQERVGEHCVSLEYALTLREESQATQNGVTRHVRIELYDIKLGAEPEPALFDIQRNYTVLRPESPHPK